MVQYEGGALHFLTNILLEWFMSRNGDQNICSTLQAISSLILAGIYFADVRVLNEAHANNNETKAHLYPTTSICKESWILEGDLAALFPII